jgi:hypothetical protein
LLRYVPSGEVDIATFVTPAQYERIEAELAKHQEANSSSEVKAALGDDYSYTMIQAVRAHRGMKKVGSAY